MSGTGFAPQGIPTYQSASVNNSPRPPTTVNTSPPPSSSATDSVPPSHPAPIPYPSYSATPSLTSSPSSSAIAAPVPVVAYSGGSPFLLQKTTSQHQVSASASGSPAHGATPTASPPLSYRSYDESNGPSIKPYTYSPTKAATAPSSNASYAQSYLYHAAAVQQQQRAPSPQPRSAESWNVLFSAYAVPNRRDEANKGLIPLGCIFTPMHTPLQPPPLLRRAPEKCSNRKCGALLNLYCDVSERGQWTCCMCGCVNRNADDVDTYESCPEVFLHTVDYLDPQMQPLITLGTPIASTPLSQPATPAELAVHTYIFAIDANIPAQDLEALKSSIIGVLQGLPQATRVALIVFSNAVHVYDLSAQDVASSHAIPATGSLSDEDISALTEGSGIYVAPLHACLGLLKHILSVLSPEPLPEDGLPKRCMGVAVEVALALIHAYSGSRYQLPGGNNLPPPGGRITVCCSGAPNLGPGAVGGEEETMKEDEDYTDHEASEYYKEMAEAAHQEQVSIDVYCTGLRNLRVRVLQSLIATNGGFLLLVKDFGPRFAANLSLALNLAVGRDGSFDVRCSSAATITRIMGPAVEVSDSLKEGLDTESGNTVGMTSVQRQFSYGILYELLEDTPEDYLYFQFAVRFTDHQNRRVLRVTSRRVATTGNIANLCKSVDVDVVSLLLARHFVLLARSESTAAALQRLDEHVRDLAVEYGLPDRFVQSGRQMYKLLPELEPIPKRLFHLRRGPLLGPILQHPDDIESLRWLFISSSYFDSLRIMLPVLYGAFHHTPTTTTPTTTNGSATPTTSANNAYATAVSDLAAQVAAVALNGGEPSLIPAGAEVQLRRPSAAEIEAENVIMEELPISTLSLRSDGVLLMDHFTDLFIWSGYEVAARPDCDDLRVALVKRANNMSVGRFPAPELQMFKEGSSMARLLFSRLEPGHKDAPHEQQEDAPHLASLSAEARAGLLSKHHRTDDMSFHQYYRSLFR